MGCLSCLLGILGSLVILKSMESRFHIHILARGDDRPPLVPDTGECSGDVIHNNKLREIACPPKKAGTAKRGNFIKYTKTQAGSWNTLKLVFVLANYCKPQLQQCRCSSLLDMLLALDSTINRITGYFNAKPYIAGCKCYMGAAAIHGFRFLKMDDDRKGCRGTKEFTVDNYTETCEMLLRSKCDGRAEMTKIDTDAE